MKKTVISYLLTLAFVLTASVCASAQTKVIQGQVIDATDGQPLIGVNVSVKGSQTGAITDLDGNFTISAAPKSELVVSSIGYIEETVLVNASTTAVKVVLNRDSELLEEVVVVGYGQQKKASSVGSIGTAKGEDLVSAGHVSTISEALQGQIAGVVAINSSSKPGDDDASLFIRGKATWGNASPLVLVDGIERNFNDVDVNEVESISVLKDASATAVYGVKGANGVILLTTKRGDNKKTTVSFSSNFGIKQATTDYEWAPYTTSMKMWNEAAANDKDWSKIIPESTIAAWENAYATGNYGPYNDYFPEVDWWKEMTGVGYQQNYNLNVRGGAERANYFISFGYLQDGDIFKIEKNDEYDPRFWNKRYNWRSNLDFKLTKTTTLSVNIAGKMSYRNQPGYRDPDSGDSYIFSPLIKSPTNLFPIKYSDGYWGADNSGDGNIYTQMNLQGQRQYNSYQGFYDLTLNQDLSMITKGLSVKATVSYTSSQTKSSQVFKAMHYSSNAAEASKYAIIRHYRTYDYSSPYYDENGNLAYPVLSDVQFPTDQVEDEYPIGATYDSFSSHSRELYYEAAINYARSFKDHNVTALALFNRRISDTASGSTVKFSSYEEAWVGRVTYNWKERYLFEANASYTGSEKFAPGKRFGFFPSFSVGWRLTEEPWMKKISGKWLSNMKIRYSYGTVGSDRGAQAFNYIQLYNSSGSVTFGENSNIAYGPLYTEGALANEDATWETAVKQNLGIEMTFFKKLRLTVDLFNEHRNGILMSRNTLAPWIGKTLPSMNIGKTKNHGIEVQANWQDNIGKDFIYYANFNFGTSESRVIYRDDPADYDEYMKAAGKPIGYQTKYLATGNLASIDDIFNYTTTSITNGQKNRLVPGDLYYIDYNADGVIDSKDQAPVSQLTYPLTTYSLTLGMSYKGFSFSAMLYAATGVYKEQISQFLWDFPNSNVKAQPNTLDRWTVADAASTDVVRPSVHIINNYNSQGSTYSYTNHSYLRLKNVEFSYSLPKKVIRKAKMSNLQFYVNGNNLLTFSPCDDRRDPETASSNVYPIVRRYNMGLRVTF